MTDTRTTHLNLPLPGNMLEVDLPRIREAFTTLDAHVAALESLISSDDVSMDSIQELVDSIKAARTEIGLMDSLIATRMSELQSAINSQLSEMQSSVSAMGALVYAGL